MKQVKIKTKNHNQMKQRKIRKINNHQILIKNCLKFLMNECINLYFCYESLFKGIFCILDG